METQKNPRANEPGQRTVPKIYGDSGYLHQVFLNLINNSADAMPRGGELRIELRAPSPDEPREVEVIIADTGTGMARETLAHIFDPMFTTKQIGTGAGLGLAICDQIVRQHAGTIQRGKRTGPAERRSPSGCRWIAGRKWKRRRWLQ